MKINPVSHQNNDTLVSHVIINCMAESLKNSEIIEMSDKIRFNNGLEVQLLIEGKEVDLQHFCDHWESQVDRMITEKAKELIENRFGDVNDLMRDLQDRLKTEIDKRLEDWEKISFEPIPDYGDLMTIQEWIDSVDCGCFIDDDGTGNLAYKDKMSNIEVYPSMVKDGEFNKIKNDFTHIVWFNK
jgi:hypothetical protein